MSKTIKTGEPTTAMAAITPPTISTIKPHHTPTASRTTTKKIGGTTYEVVLHFSKTSNETINDKITRLIQRENFTEKAAM
ncbi:MAG: transposon-encoded TnpW family protein [Oscillospiraceae bacterium]|nr:transposon-encoded TnpW family protein [Oscillospiraceae bacterium]